MATGRTINTTFLTDLDKQVLELCEKILETIYNSIDKTKFHNIEYIENLYFEIKRYSLFQNVNHLLEIQNTQTTLRWWSDEKNINACNWYDSVEVLAFLGISVAINFFDTKFDSLYSKIEKILAFQQIDTKIKLPQSLFPNKSDEYINCPLCKTSISNGISDLFDNKLDSVFLRIAPVHLKTKINENQHNAKNIRFAHKWCSSILNSRSVDDTIFTLSDILKSHGKNLPAIQANDNEIVFLRYEIDKTLQSIGIAIKQYFDYFSEYVRRVKGKEIFFYVKPLQTGFEFRVNPKDVEVVEKYLTEYANLVNENTFDLVINFENNLLPETIQGTSTLTIKQQIITIKQAFDAANFERKFYSWQSEEYKNQRDNYYLLLKDLTRVIYEKSKQPIQIFNQSLPIGEIKQLVIEIFAELKNTNTALPTEEERILDMYSHLDRFPIQNKPDYQKRVNQWLVDNSELNELSKEYLLSAEFLFDVLFKADTNDYSPFVLQFCRVIENELLKQLFVTFYKHISQSKNETQIKTDYAWDFVKTNKNKDFATVFLQPTEPQLMLAKMLEYLKRLNDVAFNSSCLLSELKTFINQIFDVSVILNLNFINKIDFVRENYRNKAAHPDRNSIKLNLSEAQKCQSLVREILVLWLENKR